MQNKIIIPFIVLSIFINWIVDIKVKDQTLAGIQNSQVITAMEQVCGNEGWEIDRETSTSTTGAFSCIDKEFQQKFSDIQLGDIDSFIYQPHAK